MGRILAFALPLALVMGLSSAPAFGATNTWNLPEFTVAEGDDPVQFNFSRSYWLSMDSFSFEGDADLEDGSWAEDLRVSIIDPALIDPLEGDDGVVYEIAGFINANGDEDDIWPNGSGTPGRWDDGANADGFYSASFSTNVAFDGTAGHYPQMILQFESDNGTQTWTNGVVTADLTVVPEPASAGLLGLGALVMLRRRRRTRLA